MLLRFALATGVMALVLRAASGHWPAMPEAPWRYVLLGSAFGLYFVLMFEGLKTASSVSTAAVFTLTPIMTAVLALPLLGQRLPVAVWAALGLGGAGALWVIFRGDMAALAAFDIGRGEAIYFIGCVSHALFTPLSRRLNRGESAGQAAFGVMAGGTVVLALYAAPRLGGVDWAALTPLVWVTLAYLVIFTTAGTATLLQYAALHLPASKVMAYTYLVPSWVVLWDLGFGIAPPPGIILLGVAATVVALVMLLGRDG
jgi:drug/metabolite transporter (DMT)-like permease